MERWFEIPLNLMVHSLFGNKLMVCSTKQTVKTDKLIRLISLTK